MHSPHRTSQHPFFNLIRLAACASAVLLATAVQAQGTRFQFDLPAQALDQALNGVARQAGVQLFFASSLASDKRAAPVQGSYTAAEAIELLLRGSGLAARQQADGTYTVVPAGARDDTVLAPILVQARQYRDEATVADGYGVARTAGVLKGATPLLDTPASITVVPRAVLDTQQAQSLSDALRNVPGVVSNSYGRRNWDDLIIRGHLASDSLYLDGLRTAVSNRVAEQLFGAQQIEVLKGPASLLSGLVSPGGMVNIVSKRPQAGRFASLDMTAGSHQLRQATLDAGTPLSQDGKAALRINALAMNSNDATDYVWSRSRWVAPSLSLDLGARTDFTILTSYQQRNYLRQQGLPLVGTILPNRNGSLRRSLFTGEPGERPYDAQQTRLGYTLSHRFDNGWTFHNTARWQEFSVSGQLVGNGAVNATTYKTLARTVTDQQYDGKTIGTDGHLRRTFATAAGQHAVTVGSDYVHAAEDTVSRTCSVAALNLYSPVYGAAITCPAAPRTSTATTVRSLGLYLRDQIRFDERWQLQLGLRRDHATTYSSNRLTAGRTDNPASATTGSAALMVEAVPGILPYVSYATSFYPNSGTDAGGATFAPEQGKQWEAGVKLELEGGNLTVAAFELRRRNVLESDPFNSGFSVAVGEERSRGVEAGYAIDFSNGLSLMAGYAWTAAVVTDDGGQKTTTVGQWLNNVPRHSATTTARYRPGGALAGWELNGGLRAESQRHAYAYRLPGYLLAEAGVGYTRGHWRAALNVKNLFNTRYYAGGALASVVALGDDRNVMLTLGYRF